MVLIREGHTFDAARGSVSAFLMGVARNHLLRRLRRERFYVSVEEDSQNEAATKTARTTENPLDDLARTETIESVRKSVLALPERYREVVVLCDLQEMSYVEAAEILGCAVGTVRSRLHRARALLIERLRPAHEEETVDVKSARCFA
jgi:RNA polymerase sigma-70 factor (ECF subfamily)